MKLRQYLFLVEQRRVITRLRVLTQIMMKVYKKGFTLIEFLVVVALIGVLATLVLANLNAARERGRDTERKADLRNIETALHLYYNDKGVFPKHNASSEIMGCGAVGLSLCEWGDPWTAGSTSYMPVLPTDSIDTQIYKYIRNDADSYNLQACLENKSDTAGETTADTGWCSTGWMYEVGQ